MPLHQGSSAHPGALSCSHSTQPCIRAQERGHGVSCPGLSNEFSVCGLELDQRNTLNHPGVFLSHPCFYRWSRDVDLKHCKQQNRLTWGWDGDLVSIAKTSPRQEHVAKASVNLPWESILSELWLGCHLVTAGRSGHKEWWCCCWWQVFPQTMENVRAASGTLASPNEAKEGAETGCYEYKATIWLLGCCLFNQKFHPYPEKCPPEETAAEIKASASLRDIFQKVNLQGLYWFCCITFLRMIIFSVQHPSKPDCPSGTSIL